MAECWNEHIIYIISNSINGRPSGELDKSCFLPYVCSVALSLWFALSLYFMSYIYGFQSLV